ncbi:uncharacterized protein [Henckelia pumila]
MCDKCQHPEPVVPGQPRSAGAMITMADAGRLRGCRPQAKRALKVYNKSNSKRFNLKKIYKVNFFGARFQYMTFSAREDGSEEPTLFRGVVHGVDRVVFCEVKDDDVIELPRALDGGPPPPRK